MREGGGGRGAGGKGNDGKRERMRWEGEVGGREGEMVVKWYCTGKQKRVKSMKQEVEKEEQAGAVVKGVDKGNL